MSMFIWKGPVVKLARYLEESSNARKDIRFTGVRIGRWRAIGVLSMTLPAKDDSPPGG